MALEFGLRPCQFGVAFCLYPLFEILPIFGQAKHKYRDGFPRSVIQFDDSLLAYYVVRVLGARIVGWEDRTVDEGG